MGLTYLAWKFCFNTLCKMTNNERQRFITISFQRISREEMMEIMERGLVEMRESGISHIESSIMKKEKQLVDRPWKQKKCEIFE